MKLIDSHMHVDLAGFDVKMIIESMDRNGVEISWLLTWEELDPPIQGLHMDLLPEPVLEAFTRHPGRFIPFYAPDPATDKLEERIIKYKDQGIRGCGELKVSRKWEDPLIESYLQIVQQHHSVVVFHMENPRQQYLPENDGYFQWLMERLLNDKYNGVSRYYISNFAEIGIELQTDKQETALQVSFILEETDGEKWEQLKSYPLTTVQKTYGVLLNETFFKLKLPSFRVRLTA